MNSAVQSAGQSAGKLSAAITSVIVTGRPLVLQTGVLELAPEQAALRAHNLRPLDGGLHEVRRTVTFKVGEKLGWPGEVPKSLAAILQPIGAAPKSGAARSGTTKVAASAA